MTELAAIKALIEDSLIGAEALVEGDGRHFEAIIISEAFTGRSRLQRQQLVYQFLGDEFTQGRIHALSMKTYTPEEWESMNG